MQQLPPLPVGPPQPAGQAGSESWPGPATGHSSASCWYASCHRRSSVPGPGPSPEAWHHQRLALAPQLLGRWQLGQRHRGRPPNDVLDEQDCCCRCQEGHALAENPGACRHPGGDQGCCRDHHADAADGVEGIPGHWWTVRSMVGTAGCDVELHRERPALAGLGLLALSEWASCGRSAGLRPSDQRYSPRLRNVSRLPRTLLSAGTIRFPRSRQCSALAVLLDQQQQAGDDRQVLEQLDPLDAVAHITVKQQGGGHQEHQQQHCPQA